MYSQYFARKKRSQYNIITICHAPPNPHDKPTIATPRRRRTRQCPGQTRRVYTARPRSGCTSWTGEIRFIQTTTQAGAVPKRDNGSKYQTLPRMKRTTVNQTRCLRQGTCRAAAISEHGRHGKLHARLQRAQASGKVRD